MVSYFWFSVFILVNAVILFVLTANVSRLRLKLKISVGDGENKDMIYAIRAHCNCIEQVPIFALILLALTVLEAEVTILASLVILFIIARVLHAYGMLYKSFMGRRLGAGLTYALQLAAVLALAFQMFL